MHEPPSTRKKPTASRTPFNQVTSCRNTGRHNLGMTGRHRRNQQHLPQIGQHKDLAPAVGPARRLGDPAGSALGVVEIIEAGIGVGLQDTDPAREMPARMLATPVTRVEEHGGRRIAAAARSVIPHVEPALAKAGVHSRPVTVLFLASTGTVVSSPWMRVAARTWRRISSTSGASVALHAPTQSARVDTSSSTPSRA